MKLKLLLILLVLCKTLSAQIAPFYSAEANKYGYKDAKGTVVVQPKYDLAYTFSDGMAAVSQNGRYGYINEKGKEIVAPKYNHTWKFIGGFAAVEQDGKYGFIDKTGKPVVPLIYENAYNYHGACCYKGLAHVKKDGKWRIIRIVP